MGKRSLSPSELPAVKRQCRTQNIDLAKDIDAEGHTASLTSADSYDSWTANI
jgi:hypothetical protein